MPNTHKLHYVQPSGQYHVLVAETSDVHRKSVQLKAASEVSEDEEENFDEVSIAQTDTDSEPSLTRVAVADWVIVTYDGLEYPGEVLSVDYDLKELRVSVMHRSRAFWKWPRSVDSILYKWANVVKKIRPPEVAGDRGQFRFQHF